MKQTYKIGLVSAALLLCVGVALFMVSHSERRERTLEDGSVLHLVKVNYGKEQHINLDSLLEQAEAKLPAFMVAPFRKTAMPRGSSSWWMNTVTHSNEDALYIYMTRTDPTGNYEGVDVTDVELLDEHGCVFLPTQSGGGDDGHLSAAARVASNRGMGNGSTVNWFRFEGFPRHEKTFRVRAFSNQYPDPKLLAEFVVHNPAPPPVVANWTPQPLPITNTQGDVSFVLTELKIKTNFDLAKSRYGFPLSIAPKYKILEGGQVSKNWQALDRELYDSSGNFAAKMYGDSEYLSPFENAWKLRVRFFGSEASHAASNETWTLKGLEIPARGKITFLQETHELQGVRCSAIAFCGPGNFSYSNDIPSLLPDSALPEGESSLNSSWSNSNGRSVDTHTIHGVIPHLTVIVGELTDDQRLTVRATDEQGREYYGYEWHWGQNPKSKDKPGKIHYFDKQYGQLGDMFLAFDLPEDVKKINVTFCIHACTTAEFIFKPPGNVEQTAASR